MSSEAKRIDAATVIAERVIAYLHTLDGLNPCLRRAPEDQLRDLQRDVSAIVGDALSAVEQACAVPVPSAIPSKSEGEWVAPGEPRRPECADPNCGLSTDTAEAFRVIRDCEQYDYCHVECAMSHERDLGRQDGIAESEGEWVKNPRYEPKTLQQKLGYLIEECGETMAAAGKSIRWGLDSCNPELPPHAQETNQQWLWREMADLENAIRILRLTLADKAPDAT